MLNRYSLCADSNELGDRFKVDVPEGYRTAFNAAPTRLLPVITEDAPKGLSFFYWGAPPTLANKKPLGEKIINTRSESFPEKQVLAGKLRDRKCIIPADGFYGWKKTGKKTHIPYRFTLKDKSLFAIAGLWEEYDNTEGELIHTFTMITGASPDWMLPYLERIPLILDPGNESRWLTAKDTDELTGILSVDAPPFDHYSVSSRVNSIEIDDKGVIRPSPPADQFGNLSLFD